MRSLSFDSNEELRKFSLTHKKIKSINRIIGLQYYNFTIFVSREAIYIPMAIKEM